MGAGREHTTRAPGPTPRRVLLVGPRVAFFARLAATLRAGGTGADVTRDAALATTEEIRGYGAVVFARTTGEDERAAVRAAFAAAGSRAVFVESPAPLVAVLAAQLEQALQGRSGAHRRRLAGLRAEPGRALVEVAVACRVRVTGHGTSRLRRPRARDLFDERLPPGTHPVPLGPRTTYVVARTYGEVLVTAVPADPAP
ncbi:hypothetical protein LE181_01545 [Streptomyces sp. SCA3-4]|uniref:hypothetical protein n=1 Tax=Streptomyces sichuanensis TaxID=2871810 RepID=UPI001CE3435D|nr:hypothetical protein [Streptomyces sichuanensis]MCA6090866.1 hypothetical protein [Streptomyces sichuanensis]